MTTTEEEKRCLPQTEAKCQGTVREEKPELSDQEPWELRMEDVEDGEEPRGSFSHKSPDLTNPVSAVWSLKART